MSTISMAGGFAKEATVKRGTRFSLLNWLILIPTPLVHHSFEPSDFNISDLAILPT